MPSITAPKTLVLQVLLQGLRHMLRHSLQKAVQSPNHPASPSAQHTHISNLCPKQASPELSKTSKRQAQNPDPSITFQHHPQEPTTLRSTRYSTRADMCWRMHITFNALECLISGKGINSSAASVLEVMDQELHFPLGIALQEPGVQRCAQPT